ncbi:MAG: hypothetical protein JSS20_05385 [Proteobacteria bacterium]|nr:hypothetical protein [Pseudomonadota bacterium]
MPDNTAPASPAPDWAAIRRRYEETDDRAQDICADASITANQLKNAAARGKWRRQKPRPFRSPHQAATTEHATRAKEPTLRGAGTSTRRRVPSTPAGRRRLLDRLVAAISLKLEQLERRMTDDLAAIEAGDATSTDHERETRAIGALIDNLGKITEIYADLDRPAGTKRGDDTIATTVADEADRCRRELAERLARLVDAAPKDA